MATEDGGGTNTHLLKKMITLSTPAALGTALLGLLSHRGNSSKMLSDRCTDTDPSSMHTPGLV